MFLSFPIFHGVRSPPFPYQEIQGHQALQSHGTRRICPGWTEKNRSGAEGCKMSCGNESALWDIIQFLLDKIHHPLGTHLPLCPETPKVSRSLKDLQNFVLPSRGGAPCGDIEGKTQMKLVELRNSWKKWWECSLWLQPITLCFSQVFSKLSWRTSQQHDIPPCRQPKGRDAG